MLYSVLKLFPGKAGIGFSLLLFFMCLMGLLANVNKIVLLGLFNLGQLYFLGRKSIILFLFLFLFLKRVLYTLFYVMRKPRKIRSFFIVSFCSTCDAKAVVRECCER